MMRGQTMDEWMKEDDNGNDRDAVMVAKSSNLIIHHFSLTNRHCMSSNARLREINEDINKLISTIIKRTFIVTYTHARTRSRKMGCLQSEKFAFFTHLSIGNYCFSFFHLVEPSNLRPIQPHTASLPNTTRCHRGNRVF